LPEKSRSQDSKPIAFLLEDLYFSVVFRENERRCGCCQVNFKINGVKQSPLPSAGEFGRSFFVAASM